MRYPFRVEKKDRIDKDPYQPKFDFPRTIIGSKYRSFQIEWYNKYSWLEYSKVLDSAFCFYCRVFCLNDPATKGHIDFAFIKKGFKNWHKANECFRNHEKSKGRQHSVSSWSSYKKDKSVDILLDEQKEVFISKQNQVKIKNCQIIERLIDIVICLAKGGRPFRGHDESKISIARGLFLDLVDLVSKYDPTLKDHLTNGPQNVLYTSGKIQNDIIISISNIILRKISHSVQNKLVSIMADETSDCGHREQMAIVLRFFDDKLNSPVEHLVAIRRVTSVDAQAIFSELKVVLSLLKVDWKNVLSVCFDGAATMSGSVSGVQMRCKELNINIVYVHCYAHCLNLVLVDACTLDKGNRLIFDFFGIVQFIYTFIEGSYSCHATFEKISNEIGSTLRTLKSLSTTR